MRSVAPVAGAASTAVQDLLTGPPVAGRVLGVHHSCVYVGAGADVVALETADAIGLPCAVRVGVDHTGLPFRLVRPGDPATVGRGRLGTGDLEVQVVRWWAPPRPRPGLAPERLDRLARLLAGRPAPVPVEATPAELVGRGDGLTPAGDDVLAGFLVAAHHCPAVRDPVAAEVLSLATTATTLLSAALLRHAARGEALPAVVAVADLLAGHGAHDELEPAVRRLLAVGHSSGLALAHGLLRGGRSVARPAARHCDDGSAAA